MKQKLRIVYHVAFGALVVLLIMLCIFELHSDKSEDTAPKIIAQSLQLPAADTVVYVVLYLGTMVGFFRMSVGSPPITNFSESMPDEELILIWFASKARDSMIEAARGLTIAIVF